MPFANLSEPKSGRPLLVFADDWGRHPSSVQHLVARLLPTRHVLWVNTIGTRPLRLDARTVQRVVEKLRHWSKPEGRPEDNAASTHSFAPVTHAPRVISPRMWPSFASRWSRNLNRRLMSAALMPELTRLHAPPLAITTLPIAADLIGRLPVHKWVYYCVDDFSQWPGYDGATMQTMERELLPAVDEVITVSDTLVDALRQKGVSPRLLTHGVDMGSWQPPPPCTGTAEFQALPAPIILFWGVIDRRMDVEWLRSLSRAMDRGTIVLVGPQEDPDPALMKLERVVLLPPATPARLARMAAEAAVLVMPYRDAPVTRAMQPLKLKEYLATGRPAVVRSLPSTRSWSDACDVVESDAAFVQAVMSRLRMPPPSSQMIARSRLRQESWERKAVQFETWIEDDASPRAVELGHETDHREG